MARTAGDLPDYSDPNRKPKVHKNIRLTDEFSKWACALIAQGWSVHRILRRTDKPEGAPSSIETCLNWLTYGELQRASGKNHTKYAVFAERFMRAQSVQALVGYDQLLDLEHRLLTAKRWIDNPDYNKKEAVNFLRDGRDYPEPRFLENPHYIGTMEAQTVMASIRWRLARLAPERFGDKLEVFRHIKTEHTLSDDAPDWLKQVVDVKAKQIADDRAGVIDITPDEPPPAAQKAISGGKNRKAGKASARKPQKSAKARVA